MMASLVADLQRCYFDWFHAVANTYWRYHEGNRAQMDTPENWKQRRNYLKAIFLDAIGGFPRPGPLNPRSFGCVSFGDYYLERVTFESVPNMVVTANLYVPTRLDRPAPAVLVPCGHAEAGKAYDPYRTLCHALASKGYVALIYDPIGQGERRMYRDGQGSVLGGCTQQHTHLGVQLAAVGLNLARYMIFDSMRAIDYLLTRPEVDPTRIGCTGCSGGGTNTAYVSALDERITAAFPVCYITTLEARQKSENIADYEQNLYGQVERGLDHHDYISMVAPRPVCIGATTEDFFPLSGARETYAAARRVYEVLGVPERCEMVEVPGPHGYLPALRVAAYQFFNRWFDVEADEEEPHIELPDESDTLCFGDGVGASYTHRVPLSDARSLALHVLPHQVPADKLREELAALVVHVPEECLSVPLCEAWPLSPELEGWDIKEVQASGAPALLLAQRQAPRPVSVAIAAEIQALACLGQEFGAAIILPMSEVPDLAHRACLIESSRQTEDGKFPWCWIHGSESFLAFYTQLLGSDWVYKRTAQILAALEALGEGRVILHATGTHCPPSLYAAVLDQRVIALNLTRPLWSYALLLESEVHVCAPAEVPFGVLGNHDLPAAMALLAPRPLTIRSPVGADGKPLSIDELPGRREVEDAYAAAGAPEAFIIQP
jgi:dienelactone hydrolase